MKLHHPLEWEEIEGKKLIPDETEEERLEKEMITRMEEKSAEKSKRFKGPWNLTSRMTPYSSRRFKLEQAKKASQEEREKESKREKQEKEGI